MTTSTFDTYACFKRFKSVGFTDEQSEALVTILREVRDSRMEEMATRGDIKDLETKIAETKAELIKWMFGVAAGQAAFIVAILKLFPSH